MPRARPVAPLSVSSLQEASEPVTLPAVAETAFDPPPPENARKLRSSPEAARKRQTLPAAVANAPPPGYHSIPRRLPPTVMAREIALALGELSDEPPQHNTDEDESAAPPAVATSGDSPQRYTDATQSLSTPRGQSSAPLGNSEAAAVADDDDDFAPPPPPPAGQDGAASSRFLASESGRPRGVSSTADNFRLAVWTYSPRKKTQKAVVAAAAVDADPADVSFTPSPVAAPSSYLNTSLPPEVFDIAFGFLSISDLAIASQVCRAWFVAADPWAYTEQHGWVPLGPLSRATHILLRIAPHDQRVTPDLLRCIKFGCQRLTLELGGSVAAAAAALPALVTAPRPERSGYYDAAAPELSDATPALVKLRELCLERPSPEDLRILKQRLLPRAPVLAELRLNRVSLPVGAREIVDLLRGTKVRELRLQRVTNITRSTLQGLFQGAPVLAVLHLEQCVFVGDRERGGSGVQQQRPPPPALGGSARPRPSLTPTGIAPMPPSVNPSVSAPSAKFRVTGRIVAARARGAATAYRVLEMIQHGGGAEAASSSRGGPRTARKPASSAAEPAGAGPCMACTLQGMPCDEHAQQQVRALPAAMPTVPQQHRFVAPHPHQHQLHNARPAGTHASPPRQFGFVAPPGAVSEHGQARHMQPAVGGFGAHRPNVPMSGNFSSAFGSSAFHQLADGGYPRPPPLAPRLPGALFDARNAARTGYHPASQPPPQPAAGYQHPATSDHQPLPPLPLNH